MSIMVRASEASRAVASLLRTNRFVTIAQFVRRVELPTRYRIVRQDRQVHWNQAGGVLNEDVGYFARDSGFGGPDGRLWSGHEGNRPGLAEGRVRRSAGSRGGDQRGSGVRSGAGCGQKS